MYNRLFVYCPAPLQNSCFLYIQTDFIFLIPAYLGCPGKEAVKWCNSSNSSSLVTMTSLHHDDVVIGAAMSSGEILPPSPIDALNNRRVNRTFALRNCRLSLC